MKKYMTIVALLAAGSALANAETANFDFKAENLGGATNLTSVTLNDALTKFEATITALPDESSDNYLAAGAWNGQSGAEYDFIKGAERNVSLTLTFSSLVAGSTYDITLVTGVPFEDAGSWNSLTTENDYESSSLALGQQNIEVRKLTTYVVSGVTADEEGEITFKINNTNGSHSASFNYAEITGAVIPEPSAFGLLAGLGALALVGARRRRK